VIIGTRLGQTVSAGGATTVTAAPSTSTPRLPPELEEFFMVFVPYVPQLGPSDPKCVRFKDAFGKGRGYCPQGTWRPRTSSDPAPAAAGSFDNWKVYFIDDRTPGRTFSPLNFPDLPMLYIHPNFAGTGKPLNPLDADLRSKAIDLFRTRWGPNPAPDGSGRTGNQVADAIAQGSESFSFTAFPKNFLEGGKTLYRKWDKLYGPATNNVLAIVESEYVDVPTKTWWDILSNPVDLISKIVCKVTQSKVGAPTLAIGAGLNPSVATVGTVVQAACGVLQPAPLPKAAAPVWPAGTIAAFDPSISLFRIAIPIGAQPPVFSGDEVGCCEHCMDLGAAPTHTEVTTAPAAPPTATVISLAEYNEKTGRTTSASPWYKNPLVLAGIAGGVAAAGGATYYFTRRKR
jgi:hypothetical protein